MARPRLRRSVTGTGLSMAGLRLLVLGVGGLGLPGLLIVGGLVAESRLLSSVAVRRLRRALLSVDGSLRGLEAALL